MINRFFYKCIKKYNLRNEILKNFTGLLFILKKSIYICNEKQYTKKITKSPYLSGFCVLSGNVRNKHNSKI